MPIALDATYSVGGELSGVGVYCREVLFGLAKAQPETDFRFYYRSQRFLKSFSDKLPRNAQRRLLHSPWLVPSQQDVFHGLNQRLPAKPPPKSVTTFHDLFVLTGEYSSSDFRFRFADQARHAAESSQLIIAVSQFTADQVSTLLGVHPSRLRVIHHGIHLPRASEPVTRERMILHVGPLQKRKNISRLVKAFESTPADWRLVLAGSAGYGAQEILRDIERSPACARIQVTGYLAAETLDQLYARASIFAFPSLDEGFGMPVLEAMAHGVPVITSNRSALPEVAGDAALLVDPFNTEELAVQLNRLIEEPSLRQEWTAKGTGRVQAFSWERVCDRTWDVYNELV